MSEGPAAPARGTLVLSVNASWNVVNFRAGLCRALVADGWRLVVATPRDAYTPRLPELGVEWVDLPLRPHGRSPAEDGRLLAAYARLLRRERPSAYLSFTIKPNVYGGLAARALGVPRVANIAGLGVAWDQAGWLRTLASTLFRGALGGGALAFFQNGEDRDRFVAEGIVRGDRTGVLPGSGVDTARFAPAPRVGDGDGVAFLFVARLLKAKGLAELVEAVRRLRGQGRRLRLDVVGIAESNSPQAVPPEQLDAWAREGLIRMLGRSDDVRVQLAAADCVVLPTYYREGTPRALLEAASCGLPIITTDVPGARDVIDPGVSGLLCRPRDPEDLARAMARFMDMPADARDAMGRAGRARVLERFDEQLVIARYREALANIETTNLRGGRGGPTSKR